MSRLFTAVSIRDNHEHSRVNACQRCLFLFFVIGCAVGLVLLLGFYGLGRLLSL